MSADQALNAVVLIVSAAHLINTAEVLSSWRAGTMSLVFAARAVEGGYNRRELIPWLSLRRTVLVSLLMRALSALLVVALITLSGTMPWPAFAVLWATSLHYNWYRIVGGDGSEQMALIVCTAALLATGPFTSPETKTAALWFIGGQCLLAYFAAGVAKLASRTWRRGDAISRVLATEAHGSPFFYAQMAQNPWIARGLAWSAIAFELCAPPAALISPDAAVALVAMGGVFHVGCAVTMGLNGFLLAFGATYPAVLFIAGS